MKYIYTFNTEREQLESLEFMNNDEPIVAGNYETNKISLTKNALNDKSYYYANSEGEILNNYLEINKNYEIKSNVSPIDSEKIAVINKESNEIEKYDLLQFKKINESPIYKVGLISDVHYNDIDSSDENPLTFNDDGSEYSEDLKNAIKYYANNGMDFVCCSGDISTDSEEHLRNYKRCVTKYNNNMPIYTCSGNHDTAPKFYNKELWKETAIINNDKEIHYSEGNRETSYYFIKKLNSGKKDVYIFLDVDYGNGEDGNGYHTHKPRLLKKEELLMHDEVENYDYHLYNPETLIWLSNILEEHKNDRCFIFTHLMFDEYAGTYHNTDYFNYSLSQVDIIKRHYDQGEYLYNLLESYSNNYWFSGHSHYKWVWHKLDSEINVSKTNNNSFTIHIPSLARPFKYAVTNYQVNLLESESGIMEVYDDFVVIYGLILKDQLYNAEIQIPDDDEYEYANAEMFKNQNADGYVQNIEDGYLQFNLPTSRNIYFNPNDIINKSNCTNAKFFVKFEDISAWIDNTEEDITDEVLEEELIGFRDNTTNPSLYPYYLIDNHIYTVYQNGLLFKKSSVSKFINDRVKVKLKIKYCIKFENYLNKILPIAIYKL